MERKVHISSKWWKIMTQYSKEVKTTRRCVEDAMKENREECMLMGEDFNGRIGERNWEEERGDWKRKSQKQGGKCRRDETYGMNPRKWMGSVEREQTRRRRRGMDLYR
jgi:hypothetical protein